MPLQLEDLAALDAPTPEAGSPLMLPVDAIDEDPQQPRLEFDETSLEELAATIRERGVRQPISVRSNVNRPNRWMLNFGARRLRACRLAGAKEVPAFVDVAADSYDQVIENEQREGLKPLEIALFVQKRLVAGETQAEIARRLGKSRQYVTYATGLIDAPEWLLQLYRDGHCRGMAELYELRKLHGEHADDVERWCAGRDSITRTGVATLKADLRASPEPTAYPQGVQSGSDGRSVDVLTEAPIAPRKDTAADRSVKLRLMVEFQGQPCELVLSVAPDLQGHVYVQAGPGAARHQVPAGALKVVGFASR